MKTSAKTDRVMQDITKAVADAISNGTAPWQKPWESRFDADWPVNLTTGRQYSGFNAIALHMFGGASFDGCPYWAGYKQWQAHGAPGEVKIVAPATWILRPRLITERDADGIKRQKCIGFSPCKVFNAKQVTGITIPEQDRTPRILDAGKLDAWTVAVGADIKIGGDQACYIPKLDIVKMPERDAFKTPGGYYGTLLHELTHWTGHASRLDRHKKRSSRSYAFEELIAELGCYYSSEKLGCPNECENHASYIDSWLKALDSDTKYLYDAASQAQKASQLLLNLGKRIAEAEAA